MGESGSPRILIVEDHQEWPPLLQSVLESEGFQTTVATSVEQAVGAALETRFDLILLCLGQWRIRCVEAAHRLRSLPRLETIPQILLTTELPTDCQAPPCPHIDGHINKRDVVPLLADCVRAHLNPDSQHSHVESVGGRRQGYPSNLSRVGEAADDR